MKITDFGFRSHLHLSNQGVLTHSGTIDCPDHILHGRKIVRQVITPKKHGKWGTGKVKFFILEFDNERDFETFDSLRDAYNLPELQKEK